MFISIVIPVYNEEKTILKLLQKVNSVKLNKEIILVDDGSSDRSIKLIESWVKKHRNTKFFSHKKNRGKGAAVRTGLSKTKGDIIIIQDADLEYNPNDYHKLIEPILAKKCQVVYGSRFINKKLKISGEKATPLPLHWIANKMLTRLTNILYGNGLTDMETCYKVFTKNVNKKLKLKANRFDFEPEITAKVLKMNYKIIEVPISHRPRNYKAGKKITWKDGVVALYILIKYKFTD